MASFNIEKFVSSINENNPDDVKRGIVRIESEIEKLNDRVHNTNKSDRELEKLMDKIYEHKIWIKTLKSFIK